MSSEKSRLRKEVEKIPDKKRKFYGRLTEITAVIGYEMREQNITVQELADELGESEMYVDRLLGGGINITMETIAKIENVLDVDIIQIPVEKYTEDIPQRTQE